MASPEHNSSQTAVSSSAVAGGAHGDSPSAQAQGTGTETEPSATPTVRGTKWRLTSAVWDEFTKDDAKQQAQCSMQEYPIVEHVVLYPVIIVSYFLCYNRKDILEMHAAQRELIVRYFANLKYRVAITSDMWTVGHQKKGYMVVTAHYLMNHGT